MIPTDRLQEIIADAEAAYWAMAEDADDETAIRLAADVTSTYEALLASVEGES